MSESTLDSPTASRPGSKLEMQMSAREKMEMLDWPMAKDSAWESAEAG